MRQCQQCGAEMRAEARFCALCGTEAVTPSHASSSRLPLLGVAAASILVVALAGAAWLFTRGGDDETPSSVAEPPEVAEALVGQLGNEDAAIRATLRAIDRGYVYEQLARASSDGRLQPNGQLLDGNGHEVEPAAASLDLRYATAPSRLSFVRAGPPFVLPAALQSQQDNELERDLRALHAIVERPLEGDTWTTINFKALTLLVALSRSGYSEAEIFVLLASPDQRVMVDNNDVYILSGTDDSPRVDCPDERPTPRCRQLEGEAAANPDTAPAASLSGSDAGTARYVGQFDIPLCATGADTERNFIEFNVTEGAFELRLELICLRQPWVTESATRVHTCTYTMTVIGTATGTIDGSGAFDASGTLEQRASNFQGSTCDEFPYDGSNDTDERFVVLGTVNDDGIEGVFHDDPSDVRPGVPFSATRQ